MEGRARPHIDLVAPDIYNRDDANVGRCILDHYARPDNALIVPEIGNAADYARFFWPALGRGAIGFAPFGMDVTGYFNYPLGAKALDDATVAAFAEPYAAVRADARDSGRGSRRETRPGARPRAATVPTRRGDGRLADHRELGIGRSANATEWIKATGPDPAASQPVGGMVVAQLGRTISWCPAPMSASASPARRAPGETGAMVRVEEGSFAPDGSWVTTRVWNGDQTDYGLNFVSRQENIKVTMGRYR